MKPQLLSFLVACIVIHTGYCQLPGSQLTKFYNADGCNTTESLVFEYQVAIVGDGCSDTPCAPVADNLWRFVTCSLPAEISQGFSYISSYTTATCGNETELNERIQFTPTLTSGCFDTLGAMSFYLGSVNPIGNTPLPTSPKGPTSTPKASNAIVLILRPYSIILLVLSFFCM